MKQTTFIFLLIFSLTSCKTDYKLRVIDSIKIKEFAIDSSSIRAIHSVDKETLYYAGSNGKVGFTTNEGKTWNEIELIFPDSLIPSFRSIASNGRDVFVLSIENPALLYKISGKTSELVYSESNKKVFYDAIKFFDDGVHGIAVGDPTEDCPSLLLTADGGNTWTKLSCDKLPKFEEGEAFFAASNTNLKIIGNTVWMASGGKRSRVYKSLDYGNNWVAYETPIIQGTGSQGIYSIDFTDENNGIVIGGDYSKPEENIANKAITTDGGKTWNLVSIGKAPGYKSCIQYVPETNGMEIFSAGFTGISFSNDGGKSWKQVSEEKYFSIHFVDRNTAWLSGNNKIGKLELAN